MRIAIVKKDANRVCPVKMGVAPKGSFNVEPSSTGVLIDPADVKDLATAAILFCEDCQVWHILP